MPQKSSKYEVVALLVFLLAAAMLISNGFAGRISAQGKETDIYQSIEPIGLVMDTIQTQYVRDANMDRLVEGACAGMMSSLDRHSSFISEHELKAMQEETKGEFEGIGVSIRTDDEKNIIVFKPIPESPAAKAGLKPWDIIIKIDGITTEGMTLDDAAKKIRGPGGTAVKLTIKRKNEAGTEEILDFTVKRAKVPLESVTEARLLDNGIGYVRISDFKDTTAKDIKKALNEFLDKGMKGFVLDLRWNPGGLLTASKQVCELFLPKGSLVTYTKGRAGADGKNGDDDMKLSTESKPVLPPGMPMAVLVNGQTASSSEIVTGAMQFYQRALIVGEKTFGKGSVQTIIPLEKPKMTALRLTTALYYTPADVTIDHQGIKPDVEVVMTKDQEKALGLQMFKSYENDPGKTNDQNHGAVTGNTVNQESKPQSESELKLLDEMGVAYGDNAKKVLKEVIEKIKNTSGGVEDLPLQRACQIMGEDSVWDNLLKKYHKDIHETQTAANPKDVQKLPDAERDLLGPTEAPGPDDAPDTSPSEQ